MGIIVFKQRSMPSKPPETAGFGFRIKTMRHNKGKSNLALLIKIIIILDIYEKICYIMFCVVIQAALIGGVKNVSNNFGSCI